MTKSKLILATFVLVFVQNLQGQTFESPPQFDSLPVIRHLKQHLDLIGSIRCATYLFAKNFTVKDSLGNIYVSLYYNKNNYETTQENIKTTAISLFNVSYFYALEPIVDHLKGSYQSFVITAYDKDQNVLCYQEYPIRRYNKQMPKDYLSIILQKIRIPNTWSIKDDRYEIEYLCMDSTERMIFIQPLVLILSKLNVLNKKCKTWKEFYPDCRDREFCESAHINLPK